MTETKKSAMFPDYLFEVSWEVCNKTGDIYTVVATKAMNIQARMKRHHIVIGPDVWMSPGSNPDFLEDPNMLEGFRKEAEKNGVGVRVGRWNIPGKPIAILVDFKRYLTIVNDILGDCWRDFGVDSIAGNWDYKENFLFGFAAGKAIECFYNSMLLPSDKVVAQFHEWQTGTGLLYIKKQELPIATVFTAHATVVGRCIAGNNLPLNEDLDKCDGDSVASRFGVRARHSLEKATAANADVFTTVSNITARECARFLGRKPDLLTPDDLESGFTPAYDKAYSLALSRLVKQRGAFPKFIDRKQMDQNRIEINTPNWKSVMVTRHLPEKLSGLETLSKNLWWCWNEDAKALFKTIDPDVWHNSVHNPMAVLNTVSSKRFNQLAEDEEFLERLNRVMAEFNGYMALKSQRTDPSIAYFCMEYGLDTSLKIYSGGLGILAGDYLKETSDMNVNLCAVGFLYRYGYFNQVLTAQGEQEAKYDAQDFLKIPAEPARDKDGNWLTSTVAFPGRTVTARIWKVAVGRTDLYLLDTDFEANRAEDRQITYHLYGGDWENRLKQELLLGIGGVRALRALGLRPQIYHYNEGHAAFVGLERLREYICGEHLDFSEALEVVRASSLFTTHTPVPAGHDAFDENLLRQYIGHMPGELNVSWETLMGLGKLNGYDVNEKFSMSKLAANVSQNVNGVSMLHGKVSQDIFASMYKGYLPEELFISYVTNGVHYPTWCAREWKAVHARVFGEEFKTHHYDKKCFEGIYDVPDTEVWSVRKVLKKALIDAVNEKLADTSIAGHYSPGQVVKIKETLHSDVLTIGFARRFATYKRATLLFSDLDRLDKIVNNPMMPVQFIFAGKAHPADKAGQDLIKQIVEISKEPRFLGKIVFVPGYDISLAKRLVQGVDVWLNNPTRPQEASGTSGEKAAMNGVMHFSVLDGWWVEGYKDGAGWALPQERTFDDQGHQNELDSATIYSIIENEIAPIYYSVDKLTGLSYGWISYVKNTIAKVACNFTTNRMLTDYINQYYVPQCERYKELVADDYRGAREIALWKAHVLREWNNISVVSYTQPEASYNLSPSDPLRSEVVLNIADLSPEDVGVEMLFCSTDKKGNLHIASKSEFKLVSCEDGVARYATEVLPENTGMYQVATRIFAQNPRLPHRQNFGLVRWL